jgi:hypothetical protein
MKDEKEKDSIKIRYGDWVKKHDNPITNEQASHANLVREALFKTFADNPAKWFDNITKSEYSLDVKIEVAGLVGGLLSIIDSDARNLYEALAAMFALALAKGLIKKDEKGEKNEKDSSKEAEHDH